MPRCAQLLKVRDNGIMSRCQNTHAIVNTVLPALQLDPGGLCETSVQGEHTKAAKRIGKGVRCNAGQVRDNGKRMMAGEYPDPLFRNSVFEVEFCSEHLLRINGGVLYAVHALGHAREMGMTLSRRRIDCACDRAAPPRRHARRMMHRFDSQHAILSHYTFLQALCKPWGAEGLTKASLSRGVYSRVTTCR